MGACDRRCHRARVGGPEAPGVLATSRCWVTRGPRKAAPKTPPGARGQRSVAGGTAWGLWDGGRCAGDRAQHGDPQHGNPVAAPLPPAAPGLGHEAPAPASSRLLPGSCLLLGPPPALQGGSRGHGRNPPVPPRRPAAMAESHSWWKLTFLRKRKSMPQVLYDSPDVHAGDGPEGNGEGGTPEYTARLEKIVDKSSKGKHVKVSNSGRFKEKKKPPILLGSGPVTRWSGGARCGAGWTPPSTSEEK
uniref:Uncharacterized protein n=1 Tax=Cairina moschata TaxID=8855 RepID=A0A8C3C6M2_CAIMO